MWRTSLCWCLADYYTLALDHMSTRIMTSQQQIRVSPHGIYDPQLSWAQRLLRANDATMIYPRGSLVSHSKGK